MCQARPRHFICVISFTRCRREKSLFHFAEKKQTQLGFALGTLGIIDGIRTDARACVLMVCDEFLKL